MFHNNEIVRGVNFGIFVILGFRLIDNERYAQLKEINPDNLSDTAPGELCLPISALRPYYDE